MCFQLEHSLLIKMANVGSMLRTTLRSTEEHCVEANEWGHSAVNDKNTKEHFLSFVVLLLEY